MEFLFHTTILHRSEQLDYDVYQLRLNPKKHIAKLSSALGTKPSKEITFWKERGKWITPSKEAQAIVRILGKCVDDHKP